MRDKSSVAIIDVGSTSITTLVGEHGVNNTFNVSGKGEIFYVFHFACVTFYFVCVKFDIHGVLPSFLLNSFADIL